jgi:hypothetical protein
MSKIISWAYLTDCNNTEVINNFAKKLAETIDEMQSRDLEVEVQYQQSDITLSALVLGREK